jgi:hypothetical protein
MDADKKIIANRIDVDKIEEFINHTDEFIKSKK